MTGISVEIKGLLETQKNMEKLVAEIHGPKMLNAFRDATLMVQRDAKIGAPVDTGRLRASITPEVRIEDQNVVGVVGSNVTYAPYVELGSKGHWLPPGVLVVWARRHGLNPKNFEGSVFIKTQEGKRFLQNAFDKNKASIMKRIEEAVEGIVKVANNE